MKIYDNVPRLKTAEKTGNKHIFVKRNNYSFYDLHWHDYFEIEAVVNGSGKHFCNGIEYDIGKGDAYLLTPVDFHKISSDNSLDIINVSFDATWLTEEARNLVYSPEYVKMRHFESSELESFISATMLVKNEYESGGPCLRQLLEYLVSRFVPSDQAKYQGIEKSKHLDSIVRAVAYVEQHFREKITLEDLAKIAGYHPAYLSRLFYKATGENYTERITSLRINYAKTLLRSGFAVSEACFASGFGSLSNFSSIFKRQCGMSPATYRESNTDR
ncbi:MAG: helix-turn-helix transcriptional regulator [Clostridia bacterium]|nr:helix-turn-helix transcriptional regulator [Clostridia bacterium]